MKRGLAAPLLFSALAIAALGSANASTIYWLGSLALLGGGAWLMRNEPAARGATLLGAAVCSLGAWLVATNFWANPSYTASAPYQAAFLIGGFLVGRRTGTRNAARLFSVAVVFAIAMAVWALWQKAALGESRAHSVFVTPATLGSAINLVLAPALALYVLHPAGRRLLPVIVLLLAGLAVAQSRGAWIALGAAAAVTAVLAYAAGLQPNRRQLWIAILMVACGAFAPLLMSVLPASSPGAAGAPAGHFAMADGTSLAERLALYELAWAGVKASSWLVGSGYQSFYYLLESSRPLAPTYAFISTYFVHDDYLQVLLELGVPGLACLLAIVALPIMYAWRVAPHYTATFQQRMTAVAALAGIVSMAIHALVDFPFYIPVCVLLYGTTLGILDAAVIEIGGIRLLHPPAPLRYDKLQRASVAAVATVAAWILVMPAAAEGASAYALRQWRTGNGPEAAFGFEIARRLDSRDWRYHWYAGQFWMNQAANTPDRAAAARADQAFAAACNANLREALPLRNRIALHDQLASSLDAPADAKTLLGWAELAVKLAPADPAVRAERDRLAVKLAGAKGGK